MNCRIGQSSGKCAIECQWKRAYGGNACNLPKVLMSGYSSDEIIYHGVKDVFASEKLKSEKKKIKKKSKQRTGSFYGVLADPVVVYYYWFIVNKKLIFAVKPTKSQFTNQAKYLGKSTHNNFPVELHNGRILHKDASPLLKKTASQN